MRVREQAVGTEDDAERRWRPRVLQAAASARIGRQLRDHGRWRSPGTQGVVNADVFEAQRPARHQGGNGAAALRHGGSGAAALRHGGSGAAALHHGGSGPAALHHGGSGAAALHHGGSGAAASVQHYQQAHYFWLYNPAVPAFQTSH